jgi:hypothetical protein
MTERGVRPDAALPLTLRRSVRKRPSPGSGSRSVVNEHYVPTRTGTRVRMVMLPNQLTTPQLVAAPSVPPHPAGPLYQNPHPRPSGLAVHPVHRNVALDALDQFSGDYPQGRFAHHLPGALVFGQCVVERDFFIRQPRLLTAPGPVAPPSQTGSNDARTLLIGG